MSDANRCAKCDHSSVCHAGIGGKGPCRWGIMWDDPTLCDCDGFKPVQEEVSQ